ncbi:lysosome-associated membrane glycoprotein 2 isoform X2 [Lampris incognitus]|uniref:lysosome-associated membrane glycoprotein 2 isoform X2 n=1 Tax=Lampris incognitus TaxID=2546036 RepID=UPI0024B52B5F|nr:lysosome-associated membrane glycoprotein 2 isoform X2 [Lampris incognitus]
MTFHFLALSVCSSARGLLLVDVSELGRFRLLPAIMSRGALFLWFLALGLEIQPSLGTEVSVNNTDKLCLYANLTVSFSVTYEAAGNKNETVMFELPEKVETDGSICDNTSSTLKLSFGKGHSWTVSFSKNDKTYQADSIVFNYSLNDSTIFPNATSNETMSVSVKPAITNVGVDTCYSCKSKEEFTDEAVNQTLSDVLIQAFVNGSKSDKLTLCTADLPVTTVAPTTHVITTTTVTNVTTTTTTIPTTTIPTTTPTPALPTPATGKYIIKPDENSTACLLASVGLRIGFRQGEKYQEINLEPNGTTVSGTCGTNSSELVLRSNTVTFMFTFTSDAKTKKFHLHALNVTASPSSGVVFTETNNNLTLWEATVGSSYLCNKEQNYNITSLLTLYTYELQVQPFAINKGVFSTAHECSMDDTSILIPIIVGAALAGLILIVVIAYVIGRRKTYVGYQTL